MTPHLNDKHCAKILVVDDDPSLRNMLQRILSKADYDISIAQDGQDALCQVFQCFPDVIILDLMMPKMNGFEVVTCLKQDPRTRNIPIILLTGVDSCDNHVKAMDIGANDFLSKTSRPAEILARVRSHLKIKELNDRLYAQRKALKATVDRRFQQYRDASLEIMWRLTSASEYRDNETGAHIKRMTHYSAAIARKLGLGIRTVECIFYGAPMHDLGKIGIPDRILLKPGKLDPIEWEIMKMHTTIGSNILKGSKIAFVNMGATIAITHHEKWDGSGYPNGLKGRKIPLAGRIVALADVFDALTSNRPYKEAFSLEQSYRIIEEGRGTHFDPRVVEAFFSIQDEILSIKEKFQDEKQIPLECLEYLSVEEGLVTVKECIGS